MVDIEVRRATLPVMAREIRGDVVQIRLFPSEKALIDEALEEWKSQLPAGLEPTRSDFVRMAVNEKAKALVGQGRRRKRGS